MKYFAILLLICCVGCDSYTLDVTPQSLWESPLPTPVLLDYVEMQVLPGEDDNLHTCISFHIFELGSRTDYAYEPSEILGHTVRVYVDGNRIHTWVYVLMGWFDNTICFEHHLGSEGLHVADVAFSTSSGNDNRYTWAFRIDIDAAGEPVVSYPAFLQY